MTYTLTLTPVLPLFRYYYIQDVAAFFFFPFVLLIAVKPEFKGD